MLMEFESSSASRVFPSLDQNVDGAWRADGHQTAGTTIMGGHLEKQIGAAGEHSSPVAEALQGRKAEALIEGWEHEQSGPSEKPIELALRNPVAREGFDARNATSG